MRILLPQQLRRQDDSIWLGFAEIEPRQNIIPVDEAEQLAGRPVVQLSSFVGVDTKNHKVNILLLKVTKASVFGQNTSNKFVGNTSMPSLL